MDALLQENRTLTQDNRTLSQENNNIRRINQSLTTDINQLKENVKGLDKERREYQANFQETERNNMDLRQQLNRITCQKCSNKLY